VLDVLKEENYAQKSEEMGTYLQNEFRRIAQNSPILGDVRGKGMLIAV
jgi:diaminobutyrate-2-oxoglutarate transaminase